MCNLIGWYSLQRPFTLGISGFCLLTVLCVIVRSRLKQHSNSAKFSLSSSFLIMKQILARFFGSKNRFATPPQLVLPPRDDGVSMRKPHVSLQCCIASFLACLVSVILAISPIVYPSDKPVIHLLYKVKGPQLLVEHTEEPAPYNRLMTLATPFNISPLHPPTIKFVPHSFTFLKTLGDCNPCIMSIFSDILEISGRSRTTLSYSFSRFLTEECKPKHDESIIGIMLVLGRDKILPEQRWFHAGHRSG